MIFRVSCTSDMQNSSFRESLHQRDYNYDNIVLTNILINVNKTVSNGITFLAVERIVHFAEWELRGGWW